jgi:hypothetical protein
MVDIEIEQAICTGAEKILSGRADIVVAGGSEIFSDVPIRFSRKMRKNMLVASKLGRKGPMAQLSAVAKGLGLKVRVFVYFRHILQTTSASALVCMNVGMKALVISQPDPCTCVGLGS